MYRYRYINKLAQFGEVNYTLLLEDLENEGVPSLRMEKTFKDDGSGRVDEDTLYQEAAREIRRAVQGDNEPNVADKGEEQ